jgi:hypothetical protein
MSVHIWNKKDTQMVIRTMRKAGYDIRKIDGIYQTYDSGKIWLVNGKPLFSAMPGNNGYLVNFNQQVLLNSKNYKEKQSENRRKFIGM